MHCYTQTFGAFPSTALTVTIPWLWGVSYELSIFPARDGLTADVLLWLLILIFSSATCVLSNREEMTSKNLWNDDEPKRGKNLPNWASMPGQ